MRRARDAPLAQSLEAATPTPAVFWSIWQFDPLAAVLIVVAVGAYARWIVVARRRGHRWSVVRTLSFAAAALVFAVLQFGIVGVYDRELRWAFVLRLALLFFAVPTFASLGAPVALVRLGGGDRLHRGVDRLMQSAPMRVLGNAIVAPLVALALFAVLLTPAAATIRESPVWAVAITVLVPLLGFALIAPLSEPDVIRSSAFVTAEFLLAFVELVIDAVPGIVLRITDAVLDHATTMATGPAWFPTPLRDQHLAGDLLWFIAEVADIPVLITLFIRWQRTDRREARAVDELSDAEMERLTQEHLSRFRD